MKLSYFVVFLQILSLPCHCFGRKLDECSVNPTNMSIVMIGRSGSGISSSVIQLLGPQVSIPAMEKNKSLITVYSISSSDDPRKVLKIIDVDGLVDGKSNSQDAAVLSDLTSYIRSEKGLNGSYPNLFLMVSNFDDNRFHGEQSLFTKVLSRIEEFQRQYCRSSTNNAILLLTKLINEKGRNRRDPANKISKFRANIKEFTSFPDDLEIVVGENLGSEYDLDVNNGYTILPNGEEYPKNVLNKLADTSERLNDSSSAEIIRHFRDSRYSYTNISVEYFQNDNKSNSDTFLSQFSQSDFDIRNSEINLALQRALESLIDNSTQLSAGLSLVTLQHELQQNNFTLINQLPQKTLERVKFFQNIKIDSYNVDLLKKAFGLTIPRYVWDPIIASGFDITKDEILPTSPFAFDKYLPSDLGYSMPAFSKCSFLPSGTQIDYTFISKNIHSYIHQRMTYLNFSPSENFTFSGRSKEGFNILSDTPESLISLSAVREIRLLKCQLDKQADLDSEFIATINSLARFDEGDRQSVKSWNYFFEQYGTHVVTEAYGGGYRTGLLVIPSNRDILKSIDKLREALKAVNEFMVLKFPEKPTYSVFGGYRDQRLEDAYNLDSALREDLLKEWASSLRYEPSMLTYELKLTPISDFAGIVNKTIEPEFKRTFELLLQNKLKYRQRRLNKNESHSTTAAPHTVNNKNFTIGNNQSNSRYNGFYTTTVRPNFVESTTENSFNCPQKRRTIESLQAHQYDNNKPNKTDQNPSTNVGWGFHILKDSILSTSPFNMHSRSLTTDKPLAAPCEIINLKEFSTVDDYIIERIANNSKELNFNITIAKVPKDYTGKISPGYFIKSNHAISKELEFETEIRVGELQLTNFSANDISPDFINEFESLNVLNTSDCSSKKEWNNFFDKFGTHYIQFAYYGKASVTVYRRVDWEKLKQILQQKEDYNLCRQSAQMERFTLLSRNKPNPLATSPKELALLKHSMKLKTLGSVFSNYNAQKKSFIDKAYLHLIQEGLHCE